MIITPWQLWVIFTISTLLMITICLVLYVYAFFRVRRGSNIQFVIWIIVIMIICSISAECGILSNFALSRCPQSQQINATGWDDIEKYNDMNTTANPWQFGAGSNYVFYLGSQAVSGGVRYSAFFCAHWAFAYKYFRSSFTMVGLFGGKEITPFKLKLLDIFYWIMMFFNFSVPLVAYAFAFEGKLKYYNQQDLLSQITRKNYQRVYIALSITGAFLQIITAMILLFAVIKIRIIIGKNGMSHLVNYRMFGFNAAALIFQVISVIVFYVYYYMYATVMYNKESNPEQKAEARSQALKAWITSNIADFMSQIALIVILCSFGQKSAQRVVKKKSKKQDNQNEPDDEIQKITSNEEYYENETEDDETIALETLQAPTESINAQDQEDEFRYIHDKPLSERHSDIDVTYIDDNDFEQRIWSQFVRHTSEYTKTTNACIKSADDNSIKGGRSQYTSSNRTYTLAATGVMPSQVEPDSASVGKFSSMSYMSLTNKQSSQNKEQDDVLNIDESVSLSLVDEAQTSKSFINYK